MALVRQVEEATLNVGGGGGGPRARQEDATSIAMKYHNMVLGEKVCAAVRMVTNRGTGGAYWPFDLDSKSGRSVIEVLREKHPASHVPSEEDFDAHFGAPDSLESMPVSASRSVTQRRRHASPAAPAHVASMRRC